MFKTIYNCPSDPRIFVYKNESYPWIGVTLNFAHGSAFRILVYTYFPVLGLLALIWGMAVNWMELSTVAIVVFTYVSLWMFPLCFYYHNMASQQRKKYELFAIYNERGKCIGAAERSECHRNSKLIHHTSHIVVFNRAFDAILLQKRVKSKDIQPGKWDTAVGGHLALGESYEKGAIRELLEELGIKNLVRLTRLFDSQIRNSIESEDVRVFGMASDGPFEFQQSEISKVKFWSIKDLLNNPECEDFTPSLQLELKRLFQLLNEHPDVKTAILEKNKQ